MYKKVMEFITGQMGMSTYLKEVKATSMTVYDTSRYYTDVSFEDVVDVVFIDFDELTSGKPFKVTIEVEE